MTYTVEPNDTVDSLAAQFNVPVEEIITYNNLDPNSRLFPGTIIVIPPALTPRPPFYPYPPTNRVYVVRRGDTLWSIARRFRVSVDSIMYMNGLRFPFIFPGQRLIIPTRRR